ncbi:MAG: type III-B CRISPR module-associated protein Cmr5 [Firmicutes bacterium]|nr:type III-B CRISPR module-associated protein Cmr5 [Bacillota bacterium]
MKGNLEQKRAAYALEAIEKRRSLLKGDSRARYLNRVKSLSATIIMCGLGQSAATLLAVGKGDGDNPDQMLYEDLSGWLCGDRGFLKNKNLIKAISNSDRKTYIRAQAEALKVLEWLKKFATAYLSQEVKANETTLV